MTGEATSLRDRLVRAAERIPGAPERTDFLELLAAADAFRIDDDVVSALAREVRIGSGPLEANLDLIRLSDRGAWFEFSDLPRRPWIGGAVEGARRPVEAGTLVCVDPDDDDSFLMMGAWDFSGSAGHGAALPGVHHSFAALRLSRDDLTAQAFKARCGFAGDESDAETRILENVQAYVPPGFGEELAIFTGVSTPIDREAMEDAAMRDAVSEAVFSLTVLLFLSSRGAKVSEPRSDGVRAVSLLRRPWDGISRRLMGDGFRREGASRRPRLAFRPALRRNARS